MEDIETPRILISSSRKNKAFKYKIFVTLYEVNMHYHLKIKVLIIGLLISAIPLLGQETIALKGTIKNYPANSISISLFPDWAGKSKEFFVDVDNEGRFEFNTTVKEYAYINLNIGKHGYLFWLVKSGDKPYLLVDYMQPDSTFFIYGDGSKKWEYQYNFHQTFEKQENLAYQINLGYQEDFPTYLKLVDSLYNRQDVFLKNHQNDLLGEFFLLQRAESIGRKNKWLVSYALRNKLPRERIEESLEFFSASPERQALSFEFNQFYDLLIELEKQEQKLALRSLTEEISFLKNLFIYGKMERPIAELKVQQLMLNYVENHVYTSEMAKGYEVYDSFVRNQKLKNLVKSEVLRRKIFQEGFVLDGNYIETKVSSLGARETKKRNTLLYVYDTSCIICEEDVSYFPIIENNFEKRERFQIKVIKNNTNEAFIEPLSHSYEQFSIDRPNRFNERFKVREIPQVYLINQDGIIYGDLPTPSDDQGRSLIKKLRSILSEKEE